MDTRIAFHPTRQQQDYKFRPRQAVPFGTPLVSGRATVTICSRHATACTLVLSEGAQRVYPW